MAPHWFLFKTWTSTETAWKKADLQHSFSRQWLCPYTCSAKPHDGWQVFIGHPSCTVALDWHTSPSYTQLIRLCCLAQDPKLCTKSGSCVESHTFGEDLTLISAFSLSKAVPSLFLAWKFSGCFPKRLCAHIEDSMIKILGIPLKLAHCAFILQTPHRKVPILFSVSSLLFDVFECLEQMAHV